MITPRAIKITPNLDWESDAVIYEGDFLDLLHLIPDERIKLVVTSPPYNLGKEYEKKLDLRHYVEQQERVISEYHRVLRRDGSICWQVGNYVDSGSIAPLEIGRPNL